MAEVSRRTSRALVPLLLVASLALLSLLAFNLRNLDPGEEALPPPIVPDEETPMAGAAEGAGAPLQALFLTLILTLFAIILVGSVLLWRRGMKPWKLVSVWELLGYAFATAFLVSVFLFWDGVHGGLEGFFRWVTGTRESGGGGSDTPPSGLPIVGSPSAVVLVVAVAILSVYVIAFAVGVLPRLWSFATYAAPDIGKSKRELARAVRTAIRDLETGGDFRTAVLRCYKSMVLLFEARGMRASPAQTAREFEADALRAAGVSREGVDDLTSLFEEARYSAHEIREAQRDAAIASLTAIRKDLEAGA
jgi:hypothetical protein